MNRESKLELFLSPHTIVQYDTVIFRDNFSYMISVGFPREVIIN